MASKKIHTVAVVATLLVGGCNTSDQALFPPLAPNAPSSDSSSTTAAAPVVAAASASDPAGTTFVGEKVNDLRSDLRQLQSTLSSQSAQLQDYRDQTVRDSQGYHGTVAAVEARLQLGTTPGNPILVQQWNEAQNGLDAIHEDVLKMLRLSNDVASTSGLATYLLDSIRAARGLSGAVDEDHHQLRILEDETNSTTVMIERLLTDLATDIQRQQQYLAGERNNLNALALAIKSGQYLGSSLASARTGGASIAAGPQVLSGVDRPLVVIRFDRPHVVYEDALYTAVKSALDRRPNAVFDVIGVVPIGGTPGSTAIQETTARRNAEAVIRSLSQMGLPADRVRLSAANSADASTGEVRVFVR